MTERIAAEPRFATDPGTAAYYDARAAEYDEWYRSEGSFASRERPGWHEEVERIVELVAALPPARTLDVACGTGFLTRHLREVWCEGRWFVAVRSARAGGSSSARG